MIEGASDRREATATAGIGRSDDGPRLLTAEQVRERLLTEWKLPPDAVGIPQVRRWMKNGDLYLVVLKKRWYTPRADVDRFAVQLMTPPERRAS